MSVKIEIQTDIIIENIKEIWILNRECMKIYYKNGNIDTFKFSKREE